MRTRGLRTLLGDLKVFSVPQAGRNENAQALKRSAHAGPTPQIFEDAEGSVIRLLELLIERAHQARASDVHIEPRENSLVVRVRVDGILRDVTELPPNIHHEVISRLKILCGLRTDEHQAAQDGRFKHAHQDTSNPGGSDERETTERSSANIDVRVSIVPTYHGENAVLRLLSDQAEEFTLDTLGFTPENRELIVRAIRKPHGMILATGPTGSGKTTTLYTLVKMLSTPDVSTITIEDPIEYSVAGINQIQVNQHTGLTFASGLRSMLRQDPNIIMIGEIRDRETAGLAVNTALTGHLVLSTLHTNDAPTTLPRLLDMSVEPYLIASTVNIAIGQRLVRKICTQCKVKKTHTRTERKSFAEMIPTSFPLKNQSFYTGSGCDQCAGSGYWGRAGLHEVMVINAPIRETILRRASASEIRETALAHGMRPLVMDGMYKAMAGITTIEEVLRVRYD